MRRHMSPDDTLRAGGRWLFTVRSELSFIDPDGAQPFEYRVFSVDECGGDLREPAPGVYNLLPNSTEELVLGCRSDGQVGIDPLGERSPWPVFERGASCASTVLPEGLVGLAYDAQDNPWVAINRTPEVPGSPTELLIPGTTTGFASVDGRLLFQKNTSLTVLDVETAEETTLIEGLRESRLSADRRWLLWAEDLEFGDPCNNIPMHLYDFENDTDTVVGHGCVLAHLTHDASVLSYHVYDPTQTVHLLPGTGNEVALHLDDHVVGRTGDDHLIVQRVRQDSSRDILSVNSSDGSESLLFAGGSVARVLDDSVEVFGSVVGGAASVWRVPLDGSEPTMILQRTQSYYTPVGDHLIWTSDADHTATGMLLAVDPNDLVEKLVDIGVRSRTELLDGEGNAEMVLYNVEDGDRSGVYILGAG